MLLCISFLLVVVISVLVNSKLALVNRNSAPLRDALDGDARVVSVALVDEVRLVAVAALHVSDALDEAELRIGLAGVEDVINAGFCLHVNPLVVNYACVTPRQNV